jgi:hypothetical protein
LVSGEDLQPAALFSGSCEAKMEGRLLRFVLYEIDESNHIP